MQKVGCIVAGRSGILHTCWSTSLIRCTRTKQHGFTNLWCVGTSVWKRQEVYSPCGDRFSVVFVPFWTVEIPDNWRGRRSPFPGSLLLQIWLLWILSSGGLWKILFIVKNAKCVSCVIESSELQSALPMKCLPVPVQKLNIVLMCVVPLTVPYWAVLSTKWTLWGPVFENVWISHIYIYIFYGWWCIMIYFIAI
jgi:hypothetical protein